MALTSFADVRGMCELSEGLGWEASNPCAPPESRNGEQKPELFVPATAVAERFTESAECERGNKEALEGALPVRLSRINTSWRIVWYLRSAPGLMETRFGEVAEEPAKSDIGEVSPSDIARGLDTAVDGEPELEEGAEKSADVRDEERGEQQVEAAAIFASFASRFRLGFEVSNPPDPMIDSGYFMMYSRLDLSSRICDWSSASRSADAGSLIFSSSSSIDLSRLLMRL